MSRTLGSVLGARCDAFGKRGDKKRQVVRALCRLAEPLSAMAPTLWWATERARGNSKRLI